MLGFFKRRRPSLLDATIRVMYGPGARRTADLQQSILLAHEELLLRKVPLSSVRQKASELYAGPMPYSTHDLAASVALGFFRDPEWEDALDACQMSARALVLNWVQNGKVVSMLAEAFENTLYERYHPKQKAASAQAGAPDFAGLIRQILMLQMSRKYEKPEQLVPDLQSNKLAAGYVFGFHGACLGMTGGKHAGDLPTEIAQVYMDIFGQRSGFVLFQTAVAMQKDKEFYTGRIEGGEDYAKFIKEKVPPMGLQRILVLGFDMAAVQRGQRLTEP